MKKFMSLSAVLFLLSVFMALPIQAAWYDALIPTLESPNISADTLYLWEDNKFSGGLGTDIASVKFVTLRGQYVAPTDETPAMGGVSLALNLTELISMSGGQWKLNQSWSIGVSGITNLDGKVKVEPAVYLSAKAITF